MESLTGLVIMQLLVANHSCSCPEIQEEWGWASREAKLGVGKDFWKKIPGDMVCRQRAFLAVNHPSALPHALVQSRSQFPP